MKVLVVIPVYNEENNITNVLNRIEATGNNYDVLVVDDGSTDSTYKKCANRKNVSIVRLPYNLGIGGARQTGFKYALKKDYDVVIQLDGDDQHNPLYIESMLKKIDEGNSLCIGSRFIDYEGFQSSFMRRIGISIIYGLLRLITGYCITDPTSGFRACDKQAIKLFANDYPQDYPEPESIVSASMKNLKICEVSVEMDARGNGKSSIGNLSSVYFMAKVTIAILISLQVDFKAIH